MVSSSEIAPGEELGRSVLSSKNAARARRSRLPYHEFLAPIGEATISVDRLNEAGPERATAIAEERATGRGRTFYGWAVVAAGDAATNDRRVVYSPVPDSNPYHADIVLPPGVAEDRDEQIRHARELADLSVWRERPT